MSDPRPDYDRYDYSRKGIVAFSTTTFAGVMLCMIAVFGILEGIAAVADDDVYVRGLNYTYEFDLTAWGWIHIVIGVLALATGIGILAQQTWGRIFGIMIAGLAAVANFAFLPYSPYWSILIIAFCVFVIWALCQQIANERH